jgi:hypothetical protein
MKQIFLMITAVAFFASCSSDKTKGKGTGTDSTGTTTSTTSSDKEPVKMAYTPGYSTSFEMGNPAYAAMVVQGSWKDWEMNSMDNMKSWVADTCVAFQSDNTMVQGLDSLQARWKRGRAGYTNVIDTLDAAMAVYSTDKKENWVLVWAREIDTDKKGKVDTVNIQETWRINKDGKADMLLQFDRHARKQ